MADKKADIDVADSPPAPTPAERVESWKEIAAYLQRDVRTVQRWEKSEALPVYRHMHEERGTVYAYKAELDAWWNNRRPRLQEQEKDTASARIRLPWKALAAGLVLTLGGVTTWLNRDALFFTRAASKTGSSGMTLRQVWTPPELLGPAAISRDGQYLAFAGGGPGPLLLHDLRGDQTQPLTYPSPYPEYAAQSALSPDGKSVAYRWFNQDFIWELRTLELATREPRVLYKHPKVVVTGALEWSPDARQIATVLLTPEQDMQLALVSLADGSVSVLKTFRGSFPRKLSFSPDGHFVAYDRALNPDSQAHDVFLASTDGRVETQLIHHPANDFVLGWTPDGGGLLFASDRTGSMGAWIIPTNAGQAAGAPRLVKPDLGTLAPLGFSQEGSYYYSLQRETSNVYVAELDVSAGTVQSPPASVSPRFEGSQHAPEWSPDGRYLAHLFERPIVEGQQEKWGLSIRDLKTVEERELPLQLQRARDLSWSPDGRSFAAVCKLVGNRGGLCRIAAHSGEVTLMVESLGHSYIYRPAWSPDGKSLFYARIDWDKKMYRFFQRELETGRDVELLRAVAPGGIANPALAPEGRRLAFFSRDSETEEHLLKIMDTEERKPRVLLRLAKGTAPYDVAWTPDGRYLLFAHSVRNSRQPRGELWRIPADGGTPERIELKAVYPRGLRPHPDGRRIAFLDGTTSTEIWAMENFLPAR